jgi:hypothetical protein
MTDVSRETFIVVDVETSHTDPAEGFIFTIGACVVTYDNELATIENEYFYQRIDQTTKITDSTWLETIYDPKSTLSWWLTQPLEVQQAAWRGGIERGDMERDVAHYFWQWVISMGAKYSEPFDARLKPVFVANPVTFDYAWISALFAPYNLPSPFDYRTLCLRSMGFGVADGDRWEWVRQKRANQSQVPHHAFWDAYAAAQDLQDLLSNRDEQGYHDKLNPKVGEFVA